jgi:hypothetical protein
MADYFHEGILARGRERFEGGDKSQLLYCLDHCVTNDLTIPEWLGKALADACHAVHMHKVKSWDDVFGKPLAKGKRLETERRNMEIAWPLWRRVRELHAAGMPISKDAKRGVFAAVGKDFGVSATLPRFDDRAYTQRQYRPETRSFLRLTPERIFHGVDFSTSALLIGLVPGIRAVK